MTTARVARPAAGDVSRPPTLLLTVAEAGEEFRISENRMYELISRYGIPTVNVSTGRGQRARTRISRRALEQFIEAHTEHRTPTRSAP